MFNFIEVSWGWPDAAWNTEKHCEGVSYRGRFNLKILSYAKATWLFSFSFKRCKARNIALHCIIGTTLNRRVNFFPYIRVSTHGQLGSFWSTRAGLLLRLRGVAGMKDYSGTLNCLKSLHIAPHPTKNPSNFGSQSGLLDIVIFSNKESIRKKFPQLQQSIYMPRNPK